MLGVWSDTLEDIKLFRDDIVAISRLSYLRIRLDVRVDKKNSLEFLLD